MDPAVLVTRVAAMLTRALLLVAATFAFPTIAQSVVPQRLTLERIFASPALTGKVPRVAMLSPDGKHVTLLRNRPDDIERYDL